MKKVLVSLFKRFDPEGEGYVTFEDLLDCYFPSMKGDQKMKETVDLWLQRIYDADSVFNQTPTPNKSGLLGRDDLENIAIAFEALDLDHKGCKLS